MLFDIGYKSDDRSFPFREIRNVCACARITTSVEGRGKRPRAHAVSETCLFVYHSVSSCFRLFVVYMYVEAIARIGKERDEIGSSFCKQNPEFDNPFNLPKLKKKRYPFS